MSTSPLTFTQAEINAAERALEWILSSVTDITKFWHVVVHIAIKRGEDWRREMAYAFLCFELNQHFVFPEKSNLLK